MILILFPLKVLNRHPFLLEPLVKIQSLPNSRQRVGVVGLLVCARNP